MAVVTSSRHRPFCFHNFVFLFSCLFVLYNAHRISVCVIAVSKPHEFLLKVRRLYSFFPTTTPTPSRRRVVIFFHDDARDSTSTTSRRFFPRRRTLYTHSVDDLFPMSWKYTTWTKRHSNVVQGGP